MRVLFRTLLSSILLLASTSSLSFAQAGADWDIPNGHFYTQTGGGSSSSGYAVTDEGDVLFWSEFRRLGGVQAVGYPASQRFNWNGFTVQVFQRVIFQWRSDVRQAYFVNVFDLLHDQGLDDWLLTVRQTPPARGFGDEGKSWDDVMANHLAVLDSRPAIKLAYYAALGDPIQANGLPVSDIMDMGNHFALRAQRVAFQEWKEDVPWAARGQVTVALGGDIAKESGILPDIRALEPSSPPAADQAAPPTATSTLVPVSNNSTAAPTNTPSPTQTPEPTITREATDTPTSTPTRTPSPTPTATTVAEAPTSTPTSTATPLPQDQTITFGALGSKAFGDAPFAPAISASSGLLVTLSAAGKCSASGATVRLTGVGQCTVTANQSGNANWRPAAGVSQSFDISKGQQAITFPNPGRQVYRENLVIQLQAAASSGLPVSYEVSQGNAACYTVEGTTVPIRYAGGTCYIRASQPGNDNWLAASPVEVGFEVVSGRGQIQWNQSLSDRTFPPATSFDVTARTIHGELPHFEATGSCDVTEKSHDATSTTATVTTTGIGTCTVTARQPDNQSWFGDPAGIPKTFRINPAPTPTPAKL